MVLPLDLLSSNRSHRSTRDQRSLNRSLNKVAIIILNSTSGPSSCRPPCRPALVTMSRETFRARPGSINTDGSRLAGNQSPRSAELYTYEVELRQNPPRAIYLYGRMGAPACQRVC